MIEIGTLLMVLIVLGKFIIFANKHFPKLKMYKFDIVKKNIKTKRSSADLLSNLVGTAGYYEG